MNVLEVKTRVRRRFGDESNTFLEDNDLFAWINDGLTIIHRELRFNKRVHVLPIVANTNVYNLPGDILAVDNIFLNGVSLVYVNPHDSTLNELSNANYNVPDGSYTLQNQFILILSLSSVGSASILCRVMYTAKPVIVTLDADLMSDTPTEYHELLVDFCMARASEMAEEYATADRFDGSFRGKLISMRGDIKHPSENSYAVVRDWDLD